MYKYFLHFLHRDIPAVVSLLNGALAGLISKALVYPLDLTKKRLQIQGFSEHRRNYGRHFQCNNAWTCLANTVRQEGFFGRTLFFSGFLKCLVFHLVNCGVRLEMYFFFRLFRIVQRHGAEYLEGWTNVGSEFLYLR